MARVEVQVMRSLAAGPELFEPGAGEVKRTLGTTGEGLTLGGGEGDASIDGDGDGDGTTDGDSTLDGGVRAAALGADDGAAAFATPVELVGAPVVAGPPEHAATATMTTTSAIVRFVRLARSCTRSAPRPSASTSHRRPLV
jgi:hypothetical protein